MLVLEVNARIQIPDSEFTFDFVRSSGPGGQNVNKVNSKAQMRWNVWHSASLPQDVRERFLVAYGSRITKEGDLLIGSDRSRDRERNKQDCLDKLREMLLAVAQAPKARRKTKPTKGSQERRHKAKQIRGETKRGRSAKNWS